MRCQNPSLRVFGQLVVHSVCRESTSILITGKRLEEGGLDLYGSSVYSL
jgi:hypothetical protein